MTEPSFDDAKAVAAALSADERAELLRLVDAGDTTLLLAADGVGADARQRLFARGLLSGRRGAIVHSLGELVVRALHEEAGT